MGYLIVFSCFGDTSYYQEQDSLLNFTDIGMLVMISLLLVYTFFKLKNDQKKLKWEEDTLKETSFSKAVEWDVLMQPKAPLFQVQSKSKFSSKMLSIKFFIVLFTSIIAVIILSVVAYIWIQEFIDILYYSFQ